MTELYDIPKEVKAALEAKGIPYEKVDITAKTDLDDGCVPCDNYIFVADGDIIILAGSMIGRLKRNGIFKQPKPVRHFTELSYTHYSLSDYEEFQVEELLSSARIVARRRADADSLPRTELIANLSNTYKNEAYKFVRKINALIKGENNESSGDNNEDKKDEKEELFCPKCGRRYADPERKICMRCMDKVHIIKRFSIFFARYKFQIGAIIFTMILTSALGILAPYISSGFYYDEVLDQNGRFYGKILLVIGIILATRIISILVSIVNGVISSRVAAKVTYDLKKEIFGAIERLSIGYFTNRQTGGLMTQVNNDANNIYWFFCDIVPYSIVNVFQIIGIIVIMLIMEPVLTLISLVTVPIAFFLIRKVFAILEKYHAKRYSQSRSLNSLLSDILTGIRVVKAFSKESEEAARFDVRNKSLAAANMKASVFNTTVFPFISMLIYISNMLVLGVGGWMVIDGKMSYGILLTFISYMNMVYNPIMFFVDIVYMLTDCLNSMNRLMDVMDAVPDVVESKNPTPLGEVRGEVEFDNVVFGYEKNRTVIDGISFKINPGEVIGIVGHTGAGKSTLANLLIRLYDVGSGSIKIDGVDVRDISFDDLRKNVAIVSQETYLFMGTIMDNIKYARPDATDEEVITASKIAGAHDFIIKLPDAYNTRIGFGYKDLSGGERQRISIARAILRNPRILIMDEATAAMDTQTERRIQAALDNLVKGRTTIMIAHRLSTLRNADYIIVIENGKMPEFGTHAELLAKKGIFYKLYKLQLEALRNIGIEE